MPYTSSSPATDDTATIKRPVWLFSMDSEQFHAPPTTNGGLIAYFQKYGKTTQSTSTKLVHFKDQNSIQQWLDDEFVEFQRNIQQAIANGIEPIAGFSFYTWNAAEFLELVKLLKSHCPELLVIAGGPHVQQAEDYLFDDPIDVIALGEGEVTFQQLLDCPGKQQWPSIDGIAYLERGAIVKTSERVRTRDMSQFPSALNIIELRDKNGPIYDSVSYETSRGCPFKCSFCEWGTGDLGSKMYQHSLERIRQDWDIIIAGGIKNIWLADSNFGALREDLDKARMIIELKDKTGLPSSFATSWSKKHSPRVQEIVLLLHNNDLLPHYQLALQTLTPLALELSNRKNMGANKYVPIAKEMAEQGVPIAAELIWGLPGDTLASFEHNLDQLLVTFPNINIFGYTLLPGTEFYRKRHEYKIESVPVAGYGKAKGEYVVGCHTFSRAQGEEGYFLITAHILLIHGYILPRTMRFLALSGVPGISALLRQILTKLLEQYGNETNEINTENKIAVYEHRNTLYLSLLHSANMTYQIITSTLLHQLGKLKLKKKLVADILKLIELDRACCPRAGDKHSINKSFEFNARQVAEALDAMRLPNALAFGKHQQTLRIDHPGGLGSVLTDADGGSWIKGNICEDESIEVLELA